MSCLKGGLGGADNSAVLKAAAKNLAAKIEIRLKFPNKAEKKKDGRMDNKELSKYVNDIADGAYSWVSTVARPFLREMERDLVEVGEEIRIDQCEDGNDTKQERKEDYESTVSALRMYSPDNDGVLREEAKIEGRKPFVQALCLRVQQVTEIALLEDNILHAKDKVSLEKLLQEAKDSEGADAKNVFVSSPKTKTPIRAFGKGYALTNVFGSYREFALAKLAEAVGSRSRDLATEHKAEEEKQEKEVLSDNQNDISPEALLFGNADEVNEKTALLSWKHLGKQNAVRLQRSGYRLYVLTAFGSPKEALNITRKIFSEPFVSINCLLSVDGKHLCLGKMVDGKLRYDFDQFVKQEIFLLTCWVRTAAGACLPNRLLPDDETQQMVENGNGKKTNLIDNDGKNAVNPEIFYFRVVNGGAGTISIALPEKFILHFNEMKNEQQETIVSERDVILSKPETLYVRRAVVDGKPKIILEECSNAEIQKELSLNGITGVEWTETGKKGWVGLPNPLPGILSFRYKQACEAGEIQPKIQRN